MLVKVATSNVTATAPPPPNTLSAIVIVSPILYPTPPAATAIALTLPVVASTVTLNVAPVPPVGDTVLATAL